MDLCFSLPSLDTTYVTTFPVMILFPDVLSCLKSVKELTSYKTDLLPVCELFFSGGGWQGDQDGCL